MAVIPTIRETEEDEAAHLKQAKLQRFEELNDLKKILATDEGLRFFKRFFDQGKMFATTFTGNSHGMFLEGHRNLALKFFHDICESCPEKVPALIMRTDKS